MATRSQTTTKSEPFTYRYVYAIIALQYSVNNTEQSPLVSMLTVAVAHHELLSHAAKKRLVYGYSVQQCVITPSMECMHPNPGLQA